MTVGIVVFPGSNCDRDMAWALSGILDLPCRFLWHDTTSLEDIQAVVLPGGFSYGDYLRCGACHRCSMPFMPLLPMADLFLASAMGSKCSRKWACCPVP